jgi:hypothetical protein
MHQNLAYKHFEKNFKLPEIQRQKEREVIDNISIQKRQDTWARNQRHQKEMKDIIIQINSDHVKTQIENNNTRRMQTLREKLAEVKPPHEDMTFE